MKERRKHRKKIILLIIMAIVLIISYSSLHMGKGEIYKSVSWEDGTLIEHAKVGLDIDGDGTVDGVTYTNPSGVAHFSNRPYGTYYIYVDIDDDGIWETSAEPVVVDGIEHVDNVYPLPPEMWRF